MAYYTVRLRDVVESETHYGSPMKPTHKERIEIGRQKVFDFDYPLFDESYRKEFETKFLMQFYMNEIGHETFGLWKFKLETWLNLHMPYYNQLYVSTLLDYDPLINVDYKVTSLAKNNKKFDEQGNRLLDSTNDVTKGKVFTGEIKGENETDGNSQTKGNSNTDTKNDGTNDTDNTETTGQTTSTDGTDKGTTKENRFERKINTDTPDSRLQITTNEDGTGVIEYASKIDENKNKMNQEHDNATTEKGKLDKDVTGSTKNKTSDTGNVKTDANSDTIYHEEGKSKVDRKENTDETIGNKGNTKENSDKTNNTDEVKDYIEHRIGKTGVETYPEMVMKFRSSMINVDEQLFKAIRKELFMILF